MLEKAGLVEEVGTRQRRGLTERLVRATAAHYLCLLYTSDAADERSSVDLGGRRIIKKKNTPHT